jgi:diguanylate cyclase (GGDEF)-like protein/PAS domain S-box-containing protein
MTQMLGVMRRLGAAADLHETLQGICEGVVEVLDFGAAALNVVDTHGHLRCEAVAGPPEVGETLLGTIIERADWEDLRRRCHTLGGLLHLPGALWPPSDRVPQWTAAGRLDGGADGWGVDDGLFAPLTGPDGTLLGVLSVDQPASGRYPDVEQRTLLELFAAEAANALADALRRSRLRDREVVYRRVFDEAPVPMLVTDVDLRIHRANHAFAELAGLPVGADGSETLRTLVTGESLDALTAACQAVAEGEGTGLSVEHQLNRPDGHCRWVRSSVSRVETLRAGPRLVLRVEDVTEDRRAIEELRRLADHDALTGLPNRRTARRRLDHLLHERVDGQRVVVLYCDLDGFKTVNDRLGHAAGDELLGLVAARLNRVIRPPDLLCREGGDEFLVIATMKPDAHPGPLAERCIDSLAAPFALRSGPASVSVSIGVAVADRPRLSAAELLREADAALYRAKAAGRGSWAFAVSPPER